MTKLKSVIDREQEAARKYQDRIDRAHEERDGVEWGFLRRPPRRMVTVRPGIQSTGERFRRCLDGGGGFITGVETVPSTEWIQRRINDGDLEQLTPEEAVAALKEEAEAAAAAAAAEPPEGEPPPEGAAAPPPADQQLPETAPVPTEQPPVEQPAAAPAASFKQQRRAHG